MKNGSKLILIGHGIVVLTYNFCESEPELYESVAVFSFVSEVAVYN